MAESRLSIAGYWGVLGFIGLLANACYRLYPVALDPVQNGMSLVQWLMFVLWTAFMAYSEGYRGFHKQASPRVVARAMTLSDPGAPWVRKILAPAFCMGLFHATRKRLIVSWSLVVMIVALVIGVRQLDQPWRGIIDAGVVIGLLLGALSTLSFLVAAARGRPPGVDPELPPPT